jgi:hypothetical protein
MSPALDDSTQRRKKAMASNIAYVPDLSTTLQGVTEELRQLEGLLIMADQPDPRILTEFRDVVNRLRQTAWAVQQYSKLMANHSASSHVGSLLAGERIRTVCQLCKLLEVDLENPEIHLQDGQTDGLYGAIYRLAHRLREHVAN